MCENVSFTELSTLFFVFSRGVGEVEGGGGGMGELAWACFKVRPSDFSVPVRLSRWIDPSDKK